MIKGIFTASQGMTALMQKQDQISHNLANLNTTGFKQSRLFIESFEQYMNNDEHEVFANGEIKADKVHIDFSEGTLRGTGAPLDLAIKGSGFFTVMTTDGIRYTRNGNFSMDKDGFLITGTGAKVMSTDGYVRLDARQPVTVTEKGEVLQKDEPKGMLRIADFKKPYKMLRQGNSWFLPALPDNPEIKSPGFFVKQGYIEASNVNPIKNMVEMIAAMRNYEADQRAMLAHDQTLGKAVNEVGKVG